MFDFGSAWLSRGQGMRISRFGALMRPSLVVAGFACAGCGEGRESPMLKDGARPSRLPVVERNGVDASTHPSIKQIMVTLTKGPSSLTPILGKELKDDPPPWDAIRGQAREYARLASALGDNEPPRGSKESWARLTSEYSGSAAELDRAAQASDRDAALAAHGRLAKSCMSCHREHRKMGPGRGGPPGGPGFGPPPGGPPPG
jgi:hypothetical protein